MNTNIWLVVISLVWISLMGYSAAALPSDRAERMIKVIRIALLFLACVLLKLGSLFQDHVGGLGIPKKGKEIASYLFSDVLAQSKTWQHADYKANNEIHFLIVLISGPSAPS